MNNDNTKIVYSQIINGYSLLNIDSRIAYIKHLTPLDSAGIDLYREKAYLNAENQGLSTYAQRLNNIIENDLWSREKEKEVDEVKSFIMSLKHSKDKLIKKQDKVLIDKEILEHNFRIIKLITERERLIGLTCEAYADKKLNEYYIYSTIYANVDFKDKFYTEEEFQELPQKELDELVKSYNNKINIFSEHNFRKISLSPFFMNNLVLCDDNPYFLYGKPIIYLTFFQVELFQNGRRFKNILQNAKMPPPGEILNDADKLLDWFNKNEQIDKLVDQNIGVNEAEKHASGGSSVVGLSKTELKEAGLYDESVDKKLQDALKNKGELSMAELIKLGL